jgi:glutamine---fructose-6-phosphate transaminase (isomerizing)
VIDRSGLLSEDIEEGPAALGRLLDAYADPAGPLTGLDGAVLEDRRVIFSGLGSSRYAAFQVAPSVRLNGFGASVEFASSSEATPPSDDLVVVAISASGRTPEVVDVARRHRGRSLVIGVTNDPGSTLAGEVEVVLPLFAGEERSGVASRTFRATVAVLALLAARMTGRGPSVDELRVAVDALQATIEGRGAWLPVVADTFDGAPAIDVIGGAGELGVVSQAALMLREGPRLPAQAHEAGDWLHTAIYLALPGHRALLFGGTPYDETLVGVIGGRGGETVVIGSPVAGSARSIPLALTTGADPIVRALVSSVIAELLAAELWSRTSATDR